jgi:hypothetical protein
MAAAQPAVHLTHRDAMVPEVACPSLAQVHPPRPRPHPEKFLVPDLNPAT